MGDTAGAQYNALGTVFSGDNNYTHLMCYYHLIAKVVERTTGLPKDVEDAVFRDVYELHYSRSLEDYNSNPVAVKLRWQTNTLIRSFYAYTKRVWLNELLSSFHRVCYHQYPVEQLDRALKRDYTAHRLLKMGELQKQLTTCCHQRCIDIRPFLSRLHHPWDSSTRFAAKVIQCSHEKCNKFLDVNTARMEDEGPPKLG
ncbi:hypothetical protein PHMEG_0002281 [Phytophthora megakarya]|uniref:MULE transposase domain-containing protein n=1 Tax=Phytophthora megakarya TaxID=4795 RepID=A0A225X151_9STRA|nr:hypothetical protein PHMEG_0002281 [Phytophthora megakarya]